MDRIINLNIPHIGEQIFENFEDEELIRLLSVSETWRVLASNVLLQRWRGRFADACYLASPELVKFLLANLKTEEIWNVHENGCTPFQSACLGGNKEIVELILDHPDIKSMDLNAVDENGRTAFQWACCLGHQKVVQLLLDHPNSKNIDFNAVGPDGMHLLILLSLKMLSLVVKSKI